jgi:taurine dioxygenase
LPKIFFSIHCLPPTPPQFILHTQTPTATHKGMDDDEAAALLREIFALTATPEYTCRFRWTVGTVAMW